MSSDAVNDEPDKERDEVRAAFRAARFDDEPPAEVDAAIIAAAKSTQKRRLHGYFAPLAVAATIVLALGLVLRLTTPTREPATASDSVEAELAPRALESEAISGEAAPVRAEAARERAAAPATAPAADAAGAAPAAALEEVVVTSGTPQATTATDVGAARSATEAMSAPPDDCAARFGENPDGWLGCISMLLEAGDEAAARRELEAFTARFPDRVVPDAIATRLAL